MGDGGPARCGAATLAGKVQCMGTGYWNVFFPLLLNCGFCFSLSPPSGQERRNHLTLGHIVNTGRKPVYEHERCVRDEGVPDDLTQGEHTRELSNA